MGLSRRQFLKTSGAAALASSASGTLTMFSAPHVFGDNTVLIPQASHYGPFKAVLRIGRLVGVQPLTDIDAEPTEMLKEGVLSRTYHRTRVMYPAVRKSYLENVGGYTYPELRGKEPFVRVSWEEALHLTANSIIETLERYDNEALFSSSYGGWSHGGLFRPNVLQWRFFGLIGGCTTTTGDYSGGAELGEKLFYVRCTLCHVPREPGDYSKKQWDGITTSMFPRAGLDDEQRKLVLDYLYKNSKDAG